MEWLDRSDDDPGFIALSEADDADELSRRLLASSWGWRSNAHYAEAVDLLGKVRGSGTLPDSFVALLLCTCHRWRRVTAKLIAAIESSGALGCDELDELAESLLTEKIAIQYPPRLGVSLLARHRPL